MAFQTITHSLPLPRWQSNWPVFGVPNIVRLHEYKPQKTWCLRSMFKKKSSGYGAGDKINLKWDTDDSKEESSSAVVASENYKKTQNGKTLEEAGSLEALMKLLLVEAAVQKDMIAAQQQMILDLQRRVSPSSESTAAQDHRIIDLQRRVEQLEFNAAQQQMIADLQRKVAELELDAKFKSETKTPPTENHVTGDGETVEQREKNPLVYFPASSDKEEHMGVEDEYAMAAMKALQKMQLDLNAESKSKTKTPPTENHVSGDGETDEHRERNPLVYFPASSDKEEHTGVEDEYAMAAMKALQKMQLDLNAESKSKTKTPPTENHVSGDGETDEQRERNPLVYFPASSDKEEHTGVEDEYAMAAMKALQKMQLDLNAESKSKTKTPPTENHVSGDGETDKQRERNSLVHFPASSDKEEHTGVEDDYAMAALKTLQRMQLDLNVESKSKMGTSLKTPQTEIPVLSDGESNEEKLSSDEDVPREKTPLVNFSASSDGEEQSGFKDDDYTMAVMDVLLRTWLEQSAESKSKMETPLKTPQTEIQLSDSETDEEEHSSEIDEQHERTQLMNFSASSDETKHAGYTDDEYTNAVMNQISKPHKMRFS